ncbi:MAG: transposase [Planctomycetota bacterium]
MNTTPSMMDYVLERYAARSPLSLMARIGLEHCFSNATLDRLFERHRSQGYTQTLTFSATVDLMTLVVTGAQPSVRAAYPHRNVGVRLKSVYEKLQHLEPAVCEAMVAETSARAAALLTEMKAERAPWLPGLRLKILDGNHLAATERRIEAVRGSHAGPLPGFVIAVYEPTTELVRRVLLCEDGHTQERALLADVLPLVEPSDCWVGDRNFCTSGFLLGIAERQGTFLMRQHGGLELQAVGARVACGRVETGEVFEQEVMLGTGVRARRVRRITVRLNTPTRDGDQELHLLSNVPREVASATALAEAYRVRWRIEVAFNRLAMWLNAELAPLGYPKAALFGFCVGLLAYNLVATLLGALRAAHGAEKIDADVSGYLIVQDVRMNEPGLDVILDAAEWTARYRRRTVAEVASELLMLARRVDLRRIPKAKTRPKNPAKPRTRFKGQPHVSTARLLNEQRKSRS